MKSSIKKNSISLILLLVSFLSFAQTVPPPPPSNESGDIGGAATPIDTYVYLLGIMVPVIIYYYQQKIKRINTKKI